MLKVAGVPNANLFNVMTNDQTFDVEWVLIDTPNTDTPPPAGQPPLERFVSAQGRAKQAAYFGRLEGCWYGNDAKIYFVSTSGGGGSRGQVWEYDPADEKLRVVFQSPGPEVLNAPDNICVSPRGGLVLCEDGDGDQFLHGLTVDGAIFPFAKNNVVLNGEKNGFADDYTGQEFAGACFSPDGHWLLVNIQTPGITFAITGPWKSGAL